MFPYESGYKLSLPARFLSDPVGRDGDGCIYRGFFKKRLWRLYGIAARDEDIQPV